MRMNKIVQVLMERDELSKDEALEMLREAQLRVYEGEDPQEILEEMFGLEPDYIDDLI